MTLPQNEYPKRLATLKRSLAEFELEALKGGKENLSAEEIEDISLADKIFSKELALFRRNKLNEAKSAYTQAIEGSANFVKKTLLSAKEKHELIMRTLEVHSDVPAQITMAFREKREISESDMDSLLDDLADLGLLENPDEK
jgi:hypothetical protein